MRKIVKQKNKVIGEIYPYLHVGSIAEVLRNIPALSTGYAGYRTKAYLQKGLLSHIFDKSVPPPRKFPIDARQSETNKIMDQVEKSLQKSFRTLPSEYKVLIFLFPTFSSFTKDKLRGVNGFTPYRGVFHLYIHLASKNREELLKEIAYTTAHEYSHAVRFQYFPASYKILDGLINEGLAEHFRKEVLGGQKSAFAKALSPSETKRAFQKLKSLLQSKTYKVYSDVFYNDNKFPLWTGYAIGYQIADSFRRKNPKLSWPAIIKMKSEDILWQSAFASSSFFL